MENISTAIKAIFVKISGDEILERVAICGKINLLV